MLSGLNPFLHPSILLCLVWCYWCFVQMSARSSWFIVMFKSFIFLLISCQLVLSIIESWMLIFPIIQCWLAYLSLQSLHFCFMYFVFLGEYMFVIIIYIIIIFIIIIDPFVVLAFENVLLLYLITSFLLKVCFAWYIFSILLLLTCMCLWIYSVSLVDNI